MNKRIFCFFLIFLAFITSYSQEPLEVPVSDVQPENPDLALFHDALREKILGNHEDAIKLFMSCINKNPDNIQAYYEIARLYYLQNKLTDAVTFAEKAYHSEPENIWYAMLLVDVFQESGRYRDAVGIFEDLIKRDPDNVEYYFDLADLYILSEDFNNALKMYDQIEKRLGVNEVISLQKQKIYLHQKKYKKALAELQNLISAFPDEIKYQAILAEFYMENEKYDDAYKAYQTILKIAPDDPYVHISLAEYYRQTGDKENSFRELKLGFANPLLDIDTKVQIMLSYYAVTEHYSQLRDQAFELAEVLVETHPDDPRSYSVYGDFLVRENKLSEARDVFRKVIQLDSSKFVVWDQLLRLEAGLEDYKALEKESRRVTELFPVQPLPYLLNGVANLQLKNYQKARETLSRGVKFVIEDDDLLADFFMYLGDTYNQLGMNPESDSYYEKCLAIKYDNPYVLNNYSYYLSLRDTLLNKAREMSYRANQLDPDNSSYQDTYGWVLYKLGELEEAKKWIQKAMNNGGDSSAVILEHYGDILFRSGNENEAVKYWEMAGQTGNGSEFLEKKIQDKKLYE